MPRISTLVIDPPIPLNDLSRGWLATSTDARKALLRVAASGTYLNGPELAAFEGELAGYIGIAHAVGVASGTDALALALQAVGVKRGTEVLTAANAGGYATVAATGIGARVVYADVDRSTLVMTPETVSAALGPSTTAVVVTHLYGNVAPIDQIADLCRARGVALVEDCAQALGARLDGRSVGTFGDAAALSFYPTKNLGAAGDAGAVVTAVDAMAASVRSLRQYGWREKYRIVESNGRNSRLDEIQAAVLRVGLRRLDGSNEQRREIVKRYAAALRPSVGHMVTGATPSSVAHLAVGRFANRDQAVMVLANAGIATAIHYPVPDHHQSGFAPPARQVALPETDLAMPEILTLPCFPGMTDTEVARVCQALAQLDAP